MQCMQKLNHLQNGKLFEFFDMMCRLIFFVSLRNIKISYIMSVKPSIIYARVSTAIQDTDRQVLDLQAYANGNDYSLRRSLEPRKTVSAQP